MLEREDVVFAVLALLAEAAPPEEEAPPEEGAQPEEGAPQEECGAQEEGAPQALVLVLCRPASNL